MIRTREDLKRYLEMDYYASGGKPGLFAYKDEVLRFQKYLRYHEYYFNNKKKTIIHWLLCKYYGYMHHRLGLKLGFLIPVNVIDAGLKIHHYGLIIINANSKIGKYCEIHQGVNIGKQGKNEDDVPLIGDNVWIGPGAKLFGKITIADDCQIGANAVVNKSFEEKGISIAGIPAKKISNNPNPNVKKYLL